MKAKAKMLVKILTPGARVGIKVGLILAAVDFPFSVSAIGSVTFFKAMLSALYLSCLTVFVSGLLGIVAELWLKAASKFNRWVRPGRNSWFRAFSLGLPGVLFALWVPSKWIGENWPDMSGVRRTIAVLALVVIASACVVVSRAALGASGRYRGNPKLPQFHWPLLAVSILLGVACYFADRTVLVGLYENFHWGLTGGAIFWFAVAVLLVDVSLDHSRLKARIRCFGDVALTSVALGCAVTLISVEISDAHIAKLGPAVFFDKTIEVLRASTDFDGDGLSGMFGGTDCDNFDASVSPGKFDFPENGVDENCSGRDASWPERYEQRSGVAPDRSGYNLLLITVEALRGDRVSYNGYKKNITPNIDRVASESLVFTNAYCQSNLTFYTIPSLMAGRYLSNLSRTWDYKKLNPKKLLFRVTNDNILFPEILAKAGYSNVAFSVPARLKLQGINRGFKRFYSGKDYIHGAAKFIRKEKEPFFVWMHPWQPHSPYEKHDGFDFGDTESDRYDSEVALVDSNIGIFLEELTKMDKLDRTILVITADHGEEFREHGGRYHGRHLFDELIHIPLIIRIPGVKHRVVDSPVELLDLVPTLLDLLRLKDDSLKPDGDNLFAKMESPPDDRDAAVYAEYYFYRERTWMKTLRTRRWKLIQNLNADSLALYDLRSDPGEKNDVSHLQRDVVSDLQEEMESRPLRHQGALLKDATSAEGLLRLAQGLVYIQQEPILLSALKLLENADRDKVAPYLSHLSQRDMLPEAVAEKLKEMGY